jgi:hypothetical protein
MVNGEPDFRDTARHQWLPDLLWTCSAKTAAPPPAVAWQPPGNISVEIEAILLRG